jgi:hypothetical protein
MIKFNRLAAPILVWFLLLAGSPVAPAQESQISKFSGFYAASPALRRERDALPDSIYSLPQVDGVYVRLLWRVIEPRPGMYDWRTLDREVDRAVRAGKMISIGVRSGSFTPDWLYAQGVKSSSFTITHRGAERGECRRVNIPWPWDEQYQQAYARMMQALAKHMRERPGAYEALRIVKITGITRNTEEMRMPISTVREGNCEPALAVWQEAGYRPSKVIDAWENLAKAVGSAFPDKLLALSILDRNDFPPIDEEGQLVKPADPDYVDAKDAILSRGLKLFPGRFAVQWNGLSGFKVAPSVIEAGEKGAVIGWQTNMFKGRRAGSGCPIARGVDLGPCTKETYAQILELGLKNGGRYFEIWPANALEFSDVIESIRTRLN